VPSQHPPLQGPDPLQLVVQTFAVQAVPIGQSASVLQPHESVAERQTRPCIPIVQSTQGVIEPHVMSMLAAHEPLVVQQKPAPHDPASQLAVQTPLAHVGVPPAHFRHPRPMLPHAMSLVPATHIPAWQQPPLQVRPPAHVGPHTPPFGLHASPTGQSMELLHPELPSTPVSRLASLPASRRPSSRPSRVVLSGAAS
jgi:hypothetical protein